MTKHIMTMFPREILLKKQVVDYIMGSSFRSCLNKEKNVIKNEVISILRMSKIPIVFFDKNMRIIEYNQVAAEMLCLGNTKIKTLETFFTKESLEMIQKWMRKPVNICFSQECTAIDNNSHTHFKVFTDISRNSDTFIAILENIESSKKKQILQLAEERSEKTEALLKNILPEEIAKVMKIENKSQIINVHKQVTAIFADLVDFTRWSAKQGPEDLVKVLNILFSSFDDLSIVHKCEKIKTIGDCYFAVCGLPRYIPAHAEMAMNYAIALMKCVDEINERHNLSFQLRVGLASGRVVAGIIGKIKWQFDCWGPCINSAARMESYGVPGKVMVHRSTYEYIFDKFKFVEKTISARGMGYVKAYLYCNNGSEGCIELEDGSEKGVEIKEKEEKRKSSDVVDDVMKSLEIDKIIDKNEEKGVIEVVEKK